VNYTGMTTDSMANRLVVSSAEQPGTAPRIRCLVSVEGLTLKGSLRNLRNGPLPQA
jgi:hypothetical protein